MADTERLEAQVAKLTTERDRAYSHLREAGRRARKLRTDLDAANRDRHEMAAVLAAAAAGENVGDRASVVLSGAHLKVDDE